MGRRLRAEGTGVWGGVGYWGDGRGEGGGAIGASLKITCPGSKQGSTGATQWCAPARPPPFRNTRRRHTALAFTPGEARAAAVEAGWRIYAALLPSSSRRLLSARTVQQGLPAGATGSHHTCVCVAHRRGAMRQFLEVLSTLTRSCGVQGTGRHPAPEECRAVPRCWGECGW